MGKETIIKVEGLSKVFKLPHERLSTVKQHFLNIFNPKGYEKFKALDNVSFEVKKGEFFGIIGANGSGKSTLLKILAQIYQPTQGRVTIKGSLSPFIELGVGFNPELTARDNIFLNAAILGLTRKQTEEKFDEIVDFAELREFLDQKFKNFSSGMQVRLAFSIAVQAHADILLVDEVLAVGDSNFQQKCFDVFYKMKKEGKTVIFVSHDLGSIQDFCDRVLLLGHGKAEFLGESGAAVLEYMKLATNDTNAKVVKETSKKDTGLQIIKVECLDDQERAREVYNFNEEIITRFEINNNKKLDFNFGVSIHRSDGVYCAGVNTFLDKFRIPRDTRIISVSFKKPRLLSGSYFLVVGLFGDNEKQIYDFRDRAVYFKIFGEASGRGVSFIEHGWLTTK